MYIVYGRMSCPYCVAALNLLDEYGHKYEFIDITKAKNTAMYYQYKRTWNHHTVPLIKGPSGGYLGGYTELKESLGAHNTMEKILWWVGTIWYYVFSHNCRFKTRWHDYKRCSANVRSRKEVQYLSGKGK